MDIVHSHTWYTNLAGHLTKLLHDVPHVLTVHSLEPKRPWKADQLGNGYRLSSFCERVGIESADAIIAASSASAQDITSCYPDVDPCRITVIHHAVDADDWRRDSSTDVLESFGIDPDRPIVLFVGRITHQKGITHLLAAARYLDPSAQLVLRAGPADTPELARQMAGADRRAGGATKRGLLDRGVPRPSPAQPTAEPRNRQLLSVCLRAVRTGQPRSHGV